MLPRLRLAGIATAALVLATFVAAVPVSAPARADTGGDPPLSSPGLTVDLGPDFSNGPALVSADGATLFSIGRRGVMAIDTATRSVRTTFPIDHYPSSVALSPDGRTLYVGSDEGPWISSPTGFSEASIDAVDLATNRVTRIATLPGSPGPIRITPDGSALVFPFVVQRPPTEPTTSHVGILQLHGGAQLQDIPMPGDDFILDSGYSADLATAYVYVRNGDWTHTRIDALDLRNGRVMASLAAPAGMTAFSISPDGATGVLWGRHDFDDPTTMHVVGLGSLMLGPEIAIGHGAQWLTLSADGSAALASSSSSDELTVVDTTAGSVRTIALPTGTSTADPQFVPVSGLIATPIGRSAQADPHGIELYLFDPVSGTPKARIPSAGLGLAFAPDGSVVYSGATLASGAQHSEADLGLNVIDLRTSFWYPEVQRLAGSDRYATSVAVSKAGFPDGAPVAYVAAGTGFPDALSASSAAIDAGGPLLLTDPTAVPGPVVAELRRLHPSRIVVVGGPSSVGPSALVTLRGLGVPVSVESGTDRYATARAVVRASRPDGSPTLFIASGETFPDALSASAAASSSGAPLLVVRGTDGGLDDATRAIIDDLGATDFTIVGGAKSVSTGIAEALAEEGTVRRLAGSDRYATSAAVNAAVFPEPAEAYLASGAQFPDALAGGALAGAMDSPLFVVPPGCVPPGVAARLADVPTTSVTIVGGVSSLNARAQALGIC